MGGEPRLEQIKLAFGAGQYAEVITAVQNLPFTSATSSRMLGIAYLRTGQFELAEAPLLRAFANGDDEATVEYGNLLRVIGRVEDAANHFDQYCQSTLGNIDRSGWQHPRLGRSPSINCQALTGELKLRSLRWHGVSLFILGREAEGVHKCERAWLGYIALDDTLSAGRAAQNLAIMFKSLGSYKKSEDMLRECIRAFKSRSADDHVIAVQTLANLYIEVGKLSQAKAALEEIKEEVQSVSRHNYMHYLSVVCSVKEMLGDFDGYKNDIENIFNYAVDNHVFSLKMWSTIRLIEIYAKAGDFNKSFKMLYTLMEPGMASMPSELRVAKAILHRRRGENKLALNELEELQSQQRGQALGKEQIKVLLHLAYAYYLERRFDEVATTLREALEGLLRLNSQTAFKPELEEMSELLHYASMEPSLAPYLEPVLENLAGILGGPLPEEAEQVRLQVYTLGQVSVSKDGETVAFSLKGSVPLLVYLAQRPNRTRAELQLDLYPDKEPDAASAYIRQSIRELRELLGREVIIHEGPHNQPRYRLGSSVRLDLDLIRFTDAVQQGEMARALALYRGEFLPGMEESEWVLQQRDEARLKLAFELKNQMANHRDQEEWRRVILLANQYLRVDPYDFEVHEWRVEAARRVGNTSELAKYVSQMNALNN